MSSNQDDDSQGDTGTVDITYDLISTAYHALQGAETIALYIEDAEEEGNQALVQFFNETKEVYEQLADRAKQLLAKQLSQGQAAGGGGGSK